MGSKVKTVLSGKDKSIRTNTDLVKPGDYLSEVQYYKVKSIGKGGVVIVNNSELGTEFGISRHMVEEGVYTANQFDTTIELNLREFVNQFRGIGDTIFTINFQHLHGLKELEELISTPGRRAGIAMEILNGEEKTVIGYLVDYIEPLGKSVIVDLESESEEKFLMIDHSRINWFIHKNIKYTVNEDQSIN